MAKKILVMGLTPTTLASITDPFAVSKKERVLEVPLDLGGVIGAVEREWTRHLLAEIKCEVCGETKYVSPDHIINYGTVCKDCIAPVYAITADGQLINVNRHKGIPSNIKEEILDEIVGKIEFDKDNVTERFGQPYLDRVNSLVTRKKRTIPEYIILAD